MATSYTENAPAIEHGHQPAEPRVKYLSNRQSTAFRPRPAESQLRRSCRRSSIAPQRPPVAAVPVPRGAAAPVWHVRGRSGAASAGASAPMKAAGRRGDTVTGAAVTPAPITGSEASPNSVARRQRRHRAADADRRLRAPRTRAPPHDVPPLARNRAENLSQPLRYAAWARPTPYGSQCVFRSAW